MKTKQVTKGPRGMAGFSSRLRWARTMAAMTQAELADSCRLKPATISHFETGERVPCARNLRKLCTALGVSADYMLDCYPNDL